MKILILHTNTGSKYYRVLPQAKYLQSQGHEVMFEPHDTRYLAQRIAWCDVLVCQMVWSLDMVKAAKKMGKRVIFECDDLVHAVPKSHYSYAETRGWKGVRWYWDIFRVLRLCDGFISTNEGLNRIYGRFAKKSLVFKNWLSLDHWLKEEHKNTSDQVRILWAGSTSHTGDLQWVRPIMERVLAKYPQVRFIYIGHGGIPTEDLYAKFIYGEDVFAGMSLDRRESMLPVPGNVWPYVLSGLLADIAIAPLEKNYFNNFKSQCKYLEYAVNGIPGVYAKWFYTDVEDGKTGVLADTQDEWVEALSRLIEKPSLREEIGREARKAAVEKFDVRPHLETWSKFVLGSG